MRPIIHIPAVVGLFTVFATVAPAIAPPDTNYDESKVPAYTLPDPLVMTDGTPVVDAETWNTRRRPEILELFRREVYGRSPVPPAALEFTVVESDPNALGGQATRKTVRIVLGPDEDAPRLDLLLYLPNERTGPVPVFMGLNFSGNHAIHPDPAIPLARFAGFRRERQRGSQARRWAVDHIIDRGYGLATMHCADIDPDFDDGFENGVHALDPVPEGEERPADAWATIAGWAWGLSRGLDYLESDPAVDATKVAVLGHSRLGKTALWAGAEDPRFAMVISNNSGCGGAALFRRRYGEKISHINTAMPHWFCPNFKQYNERENDCPIDQHMLIALIAPRPVYVASAVEDRWADPKGEFLSARHADPVYRLLGTDGISTTTLPEPDEPITGTIGYHLRSGGHDVTEYDWARYLDFADRHFNSDSASP